MARTTTSSFGVSRRENHDASVFYERFTPPELSSAADVARVPAAALDQFFAHDAGSMPELPDDCVALIVTSPPYFAGKEYEEALGVGHVPASYAGYLDMLESVFAECARVLEPGGRLAVNVANLGRKPYRSLSADVVWILQDRLRLLLRGEVIWVKARGAAGNCAWGSFQRPANPVLRDLTERVVIASKGRFDRAVPARRRERDGLPSVPSISRDEFLEATTDVWEIPTESATRVGHPAPFPVELPQRLIELYTYVDDVVLDPFLGSGSTAVAAVRTGRHFVGYDTDETYVARAMERVGAESRIDAPGSSAKDEARRLVDAAGFTDVRSDVRLPCGVDVSFDARGADSRRWRFDVAGGFTSSRPGLRRADVLWRVLGKAAVLHTAEPEVPFVVLTPARPTPATPPDAALRAVTGDGRPIHQVVDLSQLAAAIGL
ncbi:MAG: DNA-methyltransferase [Acidimicrobiales bacterium]